MTLQRNHYEVLGVPRKATTDEIKKKYRELARKFHPDIAKDKTMGQTIFSQINQAYHVLGDPDRRAQYDATLSAEGNDRPQSASSPNGNGMGAVPSAPSTPSPQNARLMDEAETAMLQSNVGKVKAICERILTTDPRNQKALGLLGDALAQMGKPQEAIAAYRQALQVGPNVALQNKLSRLGGGPPAAANGNGARPTPPPIPPANGTRPPQPPIPPSNGVNRTNQERTDQGRAEKPSGGLFSRLLGRK